MILFGAIGKQAKIFIFLSRYYNHKKIKIPVIAIAVAQGIFTYQFCICSHALHKIFGFFSISNIFGNASQGYFFYARIL